MEDVQLQVLELLQSLNKCANIEETHELRFLDTWVYVRSKLLFFALEFGIGDQCSTVLTKLRQKVTDFLHQQIKRQMKSLELLLSKKNSSIHDIQRTSGKITDISVSSKNYLLDYSSDQNPFLGSSGEFVCNLATLRACIYVDQYADFEQHVVVRSIREQLPLEERIANAVCDLATELVNIGFVQRDFYSLKDCYWRTFSTKFQQLFQTFEQPDSKVRLQLISNLDSIYLSFPNTSFIIVREFYEKYIKLMETRYISYFGGVLQAQAKEKFRPPNLEQTTLKSLYLSDYMTTVIKLVETMNDYGEQRIYPLWTESLDILLGSLITNVVHSYTQFHRNITANHTTTVLFILLSDIEEFRARLVRWKNLGVLSNQRLEPLEFLAADISNSLYKYIEENAINYWKKIDNLVNHYVMKEGGDLQEDFISKMHTKFLAPLVKLSSVLSPLCRASVLQITLQILLRSLMSLLFENRILVNKLGIAQIKRNVNFIIQSVQAADNITDKDKNDLSTLWVVEAYVEHLNKVDNALGINSVLELFQI